MVITAMAMVQKINKYFIYLLVFISLPSLSGEWTFDPNFAIEETYTNNVNLVQNNKESSLVNQIILGINNHYSSRLATFNFLASKSYLIYSHDREENNDYRTLSADASLSLWTNGPRLVATANISNIPTNDATNGVADLISGDTIESISYSVGTEYNIINSRFIINSALTFSNTDNEDNIGDNNEIAILLNSKNGSAARSVFWDLNSSFKQTKQSNSSQSQQLDGENYFVEMLIGAITPYKVSPFIRVYAEEVRGNIQGNTNSTPSYGPGVRWQISPHLFLDMSYNFVLDEEISDNYLSTNIRWEPSARTSLNADFSQRFFGKSYALSFSHRTKRLTNSISYSEDLEAFNRGNFQQTSLGAFWCPVDNFNGELADCYASESQPSDFDDYQLINLSGLQLIESSEFTLNKQINWRSTLALSKTSFSFVTFASQREGLETKLVDENFDAGFTITRRISARSNVLLSTKYRYSIFDKTNTSGPQQKDIYKTLSATYTKQLASSLSTNFTIQYLDRESNIDRFSYDEGRAIINITKDF